MLLFAVVLFLAAAGIGAMTLLSQAARVVERRTALFSARELLEKEARSVVKELAQDPTPDADSPFDPVWSSVAAGGSSGTKLSLSDVSSLLDLNLLRTELLGETDLASLMAGGHTPAELRQYRADKGPFARLDAYRGWFSPGALAGDFTVYGYVNLNTTFEDVLRQIFAARTGDSAAADTFRTQIRGYLERKQLIGPGDLRTLLGLYYPQLYPLMNVEPEINVNFVPEEDLSAILAYPYGGHPLPNNEAIADAILAERRHRELTEEYLTSLIPAKGEQLLILQYLGVRTWFWRITASSASGRVVLVAARIPGGSDNRFAILEDHFAERGEKAP